MRRKGFQAEGAACTKQAEQGQVLPVRRAPEASVAEQRDGDGEGEGAGSAGKPFTSTITPEPQMGNNACTHTRTHTS